MRLSTPFTICFAGCLSALACAEQSPPLAEPFHREYADQDATGDHILGLWQFNADAGTADASGRGHDLKLHDALLAKEGRFGGCLESFPGWPVTDKRHAAIAADHPDLSPSGPFSLELWLCPKSELDADYPDSFLLDKKYVADDDYQLILGSADRYGARVLRACLGFGAESTTYYSRLMQLEAGTWYHVAFTYNAAGAGRFFLNGMPWGGGDDPARKSISPGRHPLSIGDRIGSYYHGLPVGSVSWMINKSP